MADTGDIDQIDATILFTSSEVSWFQIAEGVQSLILAGKLEAAMTMHDGEALLVLNIGSSWVSSQAVQFALTKTLPSMRASDKVFMFPNTDNGYYGLKFGESVTMNKVNQFAELLKTFSMYSTSSDVLAMNEVQKDSNMQVVDASETGIKYVQKGTEMVTESITTVSQATSKGIKWASKYLKKHIKKNEEETVVSDNVKWQAEKLRQAGGVAVTFSKSMVTGAVATASQLTTALYDSGAQTSSGARLERAMQDPKAQAGLKVAVVGADAAWQIYVAMANAGVQFVADVADATADVAEHKYGADVGQTARDGLSATVQGVQALNMVNNAPYTAFAEGVVKRQTENVVDVQALPPSQQRQALTESSEPPAQTKFNDLD